MKTLAYDKNKIMLPLLLASAIFLNACETVARYDTAQSTCLVLPSCPQYPQEFKSSLADEIERVSDNEKQVRVIIDYVMICQKLDIAREGVCG